MTKHKGWSPGGPERKSGGADKAGARAEGTSPEEKRLLVEISDGHQFSRNMKSDCAPGVFAKRLVLGWERLSASQCSFSD